MNGNMDSKDLLLATLQAQATATALTAKRDEDPEQLLIDLAHARIKERGQSGAKLQDAMLEIMKEQPDLKARVAKQRAGYRIPNGPPPDGGR